MSEVQGEGNIGYSDVSEVQCEGNVGYSDVCLWYRLRDMMCTVMCV